MAKNNTAVVFKMYAPNQIMAFPPTLDELVAVNHPVRVVSDVIDRIDITPLLKQYKGGGTSSYHPKMLLKVMIYAYINNIYSSRKIESVVRENVHFMWLSAMAHPDHNTINRFRSERLREVLRKIFTEVVLLLSGEGILSLQDIYTDGTKIEANANRYTFVWGKSIKNNEEKIQAQLGELWQYAQTVAAAEMEDPEPPDFDKTPISSEQVKKTIEKIDAALNGKPEVSKKIKAKLVYAKKNWPDALDKYAVQKQLLAGRNSYSKTDTDATFMRMKEDHMGNGQLKPGYNLQISTSNQYIVNYSVHPNPTDTTTLIGHLQQHQQAYQSNPLSVTADAGYGSEQNYQHLENEGIEAFIKYNYFDKEQSGLDLKKRPFSSDKLYYNEDQDCYICPMGQQMKLRSTYKKTTAAGFEQTISVYQADNCNGCPLNGSCHKSQGNRTIEINHNLNRYKQQAKEKLNTEQGIKHRKQRPVDVEPVFGNIKQNHGFRRFMLRGTKKVEIEVGLLALAQNLRKKVA